MAAEPLRRADVEERLRGAGADSVDFSRVSLVGADLSHLDLAKTNFSGADLTRANLADADLSGANLARATLEDAVLFGAKLTGAELLGANAARADLSACDASRAGFGGARLDGTSWFEASLSGATFSQADLTDADMRCVDLQGARLRESVLVGSDLSAADLREAELDGSDLARATFDGSDLRGARLSRVRNFEQATWLEVDVRETDFRGAYTLRRLIIDENYLEEFRNRGPHFEKLFLLWRISSDCGRSFWRWAAWTGAMVVLFAAGFYLVDIDYGDYPTAVSPLYYSVVTLTTLGYGDVLPASLAAQVLVILEVCVGYVALGGLVSILANKMARRGE